MEFELDFLLSKYERKKLFHLLLFQKFSFSGLGVQNANYQSDSQQT